MNAIDLYSGVGGWSLGLGIAGINVLRGYELWPEAVATYNTNLSKSHPPTDVRTLSLKSLPRKVQLVVGSPPCTHFSFSNRGGNGNLSEGLKDIIRFLQIVQFIRPRYWILENVPRTASIIKEGLCTKGHPLFRFRHLKPEIRIFDFSSFGLPQTRHRCLVGSFPFDLLDSYKAISTRRTLRDVIEALAAPDIVVDPLWAIRISRSVLTEHEPEPQLDDEQLRINRAAKQFHPVYNDMSFPDSLDRPARTVTATCTRVSRESIVIQPSLNQGLRRLSVRERASLQGFPLTYQFFAKSHSSKVKMIGNSLPPAFSLLVGLAVRGMDASEVKRYLRTMSAGITNFCASTPAAPTPPDKVATSYPLTRKFRSALPGLRFKSGMRFELANKLSGAAVHWKISFFYGSSKDIRTIPLNSGLYRRILSANGMSSVLTKITHHLEAIDHIKNDYTDIQLQQVWTRRAIGISPFEVVDALGAMATGVIGQLQRVNPTIINPVVLRILGYRKRNKTIPSKILRFAPSLLAGFLVGSTFNKNTHHATGDLSEVSCIRKASTCVKPASAELAAPSPLQYQAVTEVLPILNESSIKQNLRPGRGVV
jgi:DNA (cytosine-5)-methyltransferase 1